MVTLDPILKRGLLVVLGTRVYFSLSLPYSSRMNLFIIFLQCSGPSVIELLDSLDTLNRSAEGPVRLPILDKFKEHGITTIFGKLESGTLIKGNSLTIMPNKVLFFFTS